MSKVVRLEPLTSARALEIMTREVRDAVSLWNEQHPSSGDITNETVNNFVREHWAMDMHGYGIPIEEYLEGITEEDRIHIVDSVLASPEYND